MGILAIPANKQKWWVLAAMGGVIGIILLDETVVGVALPTIHRDLSMSSGASHWVVNAYLLVFAVLAAAGGKLGDIFGHRTPFVASLALFGLSSIACGLAVSGDWLIAARAFQGVGAAVIFPLSMALVTIAFPPEQRGMALGIYGAVGTTFLALGPVIGGFFTDFLSWRWIFWINVPVILIVGWIIATGSHGQHPPKSRPRFDFVGLVTLVGGLTALVFALMEGPDWGWSHPTIIFLLAAGVVLLAGFVVADSRIKAPLIDVDLFRNPSFAVCNLVIFMAQFSKMAVIVFGAVYLQNRLHFSPFLAGLSLLVAVGPVPLLAGPSGRLTDRFGPRPLLLFSLIFGLIGLAWIGLTVSSDQYLLVAPGLLIWGCGVTFMFAPPRGAVMKMVKPEKHGEVGGIAMSAQLVGGTIGMAVCSTVFVLSGSYAAVFFVNAFVAACVLVLVWLFVDRKPSRKEP